MSPYYDADGVTIYHGRMEDLLPDLVSWDAVTITDPPYGNHTSLKWDRWVDDWPERIPTSEMWCFGTVRMFMDHASEFATWNFGQDLVWEKQNGSSFHADKFRRVHESVVHFYRGSWGSLSRNVPTVDVAVAKTVRRNKSRPTHLGNIEAAPYQSVDGGPLLMRSVIEAANCHGYAEHPTQKPLAIIRPLVQYSAKAVLDPFAGAGSVLIAAKEEGYRAVGIEAEERYCEIAANRLNQGVLDFGRAR